MKVALFALTGLGNEVLRCLIAESILPSILVTRKEKGDYPYHPEINIALEARSHDIPVAFGRDGEEVVRNEHFDVLLVCTYHRILEPTVFAKAAIALNFHPSLLPAYRGASPFYWVIRRGESKTGLTAHYLTDKPDAGDVVATTEICLSVGETQGSLRKKLSLGAFDMTGEVLKKIKTNSLTSVVQDEGRSSYFPRVNDDIREINLNWSASELIRHLDGLKPFPGALHNGLSVTDESALSLLSLAQK